MENKSNQGFRTDLVGDNSPRLNTFQGNRMYVKRELQKNVPAVETIYTKHGFSAIASGGIVRGEEKPVTMDLHLQAYEEQIKVLQERVKKIKAVMGITDKS